MKRRRLEAEDRLIKTREVLDFGGPLACLDGRYGETSPPDTERRQVRMLMLCRVFPLSYMRTGIPPTVPFHVGLGPMQGARSAITGECLSIIE